MASLTNPSSSSTHVFSNVSLYGGVLQASNISGADARISAITILTLHGSTSGSLVSTNQVKATGTFFCANGSAIAPAFRFTSDQSVGFLRPGAATMALGSNLSFSFAQNRVLSIRTLAASAITVSAANTNVRADEFVITVGGASGASLAIHSGGTVYIFDSVSSAKAT